MAGERSDTGCRLWLVWVLVSTVGWVVGMLAAVAVYLLVTVVAAGARGGDPRPWTGIVGVPMIGAVVGIAAGTLQWLVLQRRVAGVKQWMLLLSAMGSSVGVPIGMFVLVMLLWPGAFFVG